MYGNKVLIKTIGFENKLKCKLIALSTRLLPFKNVPTSDVAEV